MPRLFTSIQWKALLRGRLVADVEIDDPVLHVDRRQILRELEDDKPLRERGWQAAVRELYPLKINAARVRGGSLSYVDSEHSRPLELSSIDAVAQDIRNIGSEQAAYPSPLRLEAVAFDEGRLLLEGHIDVLRAPHAAVKAQLQLDRITLDYFDPLAQRLGVSVDAGSLGCRGVLEYAPEIKRLELAEVRIDKLRGRFSWTRPTEQPARRAAASAGEATRKAADEPGVVLEARRIEIQAPELSFVNEQATPRYRLFLTSSSIVVENLHSRRSEGEANVRVKGRFMGSGAATLDATFRPETDGPDFDVDLGVEDTALETLNDLLRAHAGVDVTSGVFSLYSEMRVKAGQVEGYVKPLFRDVEVTGPQDEKKPLAEKLKEKAAALVAGALRNQPREEVATVVPIDGPVSDPDAGALMTVVGLVQNAFFDAILPGFERERQRSRR
jgi:hypothetical protein